MNVHTRPLLLLVALLIAVPTFATIHYVPGDYGTIMDAISATVAGDTVLLADGVYEENVTISDHPIVFGSAFLVNNDPSHITNTMLVGSSGYSRALLTVEPIDEDGVVIKGLTFSELDEQTTPLQSILQYEEDKGLISYCRFVNISTSTTAPALNAYTPDRLDIDHCVFSDLSYRGVWLNPGRSSVTDCTFERINEIVLGAYQNIITMERCVVNDCNSPSTVVKLTGRTDEPDTIYVNQCTFSGNIVRAAWSGVLAIGSPDLAIVTKCDFINNHTTATGAAGLGIFAGLDAEVSGCRFEGNTGEEDGAALYFTANGVIRNNVFRNNGSPRYPVMTVYGLRTDEVDVEIDHNLFEGSYYIPGEYDFSYSIISNSTNGNADLNIHDCDFVNNEAREQGVMMLYTGTGSSAQNCFWGDPTGPYNTQYNPDGLGDTLTMARQYWQPFSREQFYLANLRLSENTHDFGQVDAGDELEWTVTLYNSGIEPVDFTAINCTSPAYSFDYVPSVLVGGEEIEVTVHFNPQDNGVYAATAQFVSNDRWSDGDILTLSGVAGTNALSEGTDLPETFSLSAAWPNPFNAMTEFTVSLPSSEHLVVDVVDLLGRRITRLVDSEIQAGKHRCSWDATRASSGLYFLIAQTSVGDRAVEKVVLVR